MAKIVHYRSKCIGCAICFEMHPALWRMSKKDGKATLLKALNKGKTFVLEINKEEIEKNRAIADACPVKIIKIN